MTVEATPSVEQVILATGGYDHTIKIWQASTGVCQRVCHHVDSQVNALEITPDRFSLAAAGYQYIRLFDLRNNTPNSVVTYEGVLKNVTGVGFQDDGKWMYSGGDDCYARIWDMRAMSPQCQRLFQIPSPINCLKLHPNQVELFIGDQSGNIHMWDLRTDYNEILATPEPEASIQDLVISYNGTTMAAVTNKGNCFIWELSGGIGDDHTKITLKHKFEAHKRYALRCRFNVDASLLATTSADQTCRVWDMTDYSEVQVLQHEAKRWVWDAAFTNDSKYVFTASSDGLARIWNIGLGTIEREYQGHQKAVTAIAFRDSPLN